MNVAEPVLTPASAAVLSGDEVLRSLVSSTAGLTAGEAAARLSRLGPNTLSSGRPRALSVLLSQLANPLLLLLTATAIAAAFLHDSTDAIIILAILTLSVGLGFVNEFRSQRIVAALHTRLRRTAIVVRDGIPAAVDAADLVPGDIVALRLGDVVPADVRLLDAHELECDEAVLTGEALPAEKSSAAGPAACAYMGTIVRGGVGRGVVVATGRRTQFGTIAASVGAQLPETGFQRGLRDITTLLVRVTLAVATVVFTVNTIVHHAPFEALLFALAIAVSLTPQLLPAIVTVSLASGARHMAQRKVLIKRLVAIEDLGNIEVLFTDKTGTLTLGSLAFDEAVDASAQASSEVLRLGLLCANSPVAAVEPLGVTDALDAALHVSPAAALIDATGYTRIAEAPFDHERRRMSVLVEGPTGQRTLIVKGAPESVLACSVDVPSSAEAVLHERFAAGARVIGVATRDVPGMDRVGKNDEHDLHFAGFLVFVDPPKADAAESLARLDRLGIEVKIVTGDNELVAQRVCIELGIPLRGVVTGAQLELLSDDQVASVLPSTGIFARVSPEQKARLIRIQRKADVDVGFLGDGVNDAVALHDADVGISVESAAEVARDAADVVLVTKDLGILADGVVEGRRVFTNTVKYVLMAVSSNFGNMLSVSGASLFLPFLPLLPSQVLLNNLLYDVSEMTIPTDNVDEEQLRRPAHWDMRLIGRFMLVFGPVSSLGDVAVFLTLIFAFHAGAQTFRSGFFAESFLTQTLIVFAIRTTRVPFFRSRPSTTLLVSTLAVTALGVGLPFSPLGKFFGFGPLPWSFVPTLGAIVVGYVVLVESAKTFFFRRVVSK